MFDKKVDITAVYGATNYAKPKPINPEKIKRARAKRKSSQSSITWREYQELRKTEAFKKWWKRQYARQHALCYYCKITLKDKRVNVEHIIPMSKGGTNKYKNLVLSCAPCNKEKGSKMLPAKRRKILRRELKAQIKSDSIKYREFKEMISNFLVIKGA